MKKNYLWLYGLISVGMLLVVAGIVVKELKKANPEKPVSVKREAPNTVATTTGKTANVAKPDQTAKEDTKGGKKNKAKAVKDMDSEQVEQEVNEALKKYASTNNADEKIDILDSLALISNKKILDLIYKALDDPSDDVRIAAAQLLEDFDSNAIIPAVSKALDDKNEEVRLIAMNALDDVDSPEATNLLVKGIGDGSEDVRDAVFFVLADRDSGTKEAILGEAINSKFQDVKERVPDLAIDTPSHKTMEMLIGALQDKDEEFKEEIISIINFFVSEDFNTYEEAKNWWAQNKDKFDEELFEK